MTSIKQYRRSILSKSKMPSGIQDLMQVYERFREAYAVTEQYLEFVSPRTHQSNSNQSFIRENK